MKQLLARLPWRFIRFGIVGTGGFLTDLILLTLFIRYGMDRYNGQIVAFLAATGFTWMSNRLWTFADQRSVEERAQEGVRYFVAVCIGFGINYGVYAALTMLGGFWLQYPISAVAMGSIAGLFFNFPASKYFVFRPTSPASPIDGASSPDP